MTTGYTKGFLADPKKAIYNAGVKVNKVKAFVDVAAADNDGDIKILAFNLPVDALISRLNVVANSEITAGDDYDFGFYYPSRTSKNEVGAAIDADALADGVDMSSARTTVTQILGANIAGFDETDTIGDLLGLSVEDQPAGVHLCATLNTAGTAAGTFDLDIELVCAG